jgi:pyruvate/2-oxoglutarate dehydrogenase complex dihydrolipoamide acyltransferase (E2) component
MVRRLLEDAGVDVGTVAPSGAGGRITRDDAERAASVPRRLQSRAPSAAIVTELPQVGRAQGFVAVEADYEGVAQALRTSAARAAQDEGVILDEFVFAVRAAVEALAEFPMLNAAIGATGPEILADRNIGVTMELEGHLLVPVIAGAQDLNLRGLSRHLGEVVARVHAGELAVGDLIGGTFTVAAAPSVGLLVSIPQVVDPQVATLSLGGVSRRAVVLDSESIAIRSIGVLGLAFDVSAVDATTATRFLERMAELLATQDWSAEL